MNYRHLYHAGCFADVFKHIILLGLVEHLKKKPKAFCYLDTHAGAGSYFLRKNEALKTQEYLDGIDKIWRASSSPEEVSHYLTLIRKSHAENHESDRCSFYPGSPLIVKSLLRPEDRMILCELHSEDYAKLRQLFHSDHQVAVHHLDAYLGLKAFLPPKEKRGLVLIDPSYEQKDEFEQVATGLQFALKRWPVGIYAVWYPLKKNLFTADHLNLVLNSIDRPLLMVELSISKESLLNSLTGCGLLIINPPWQFDQQLRTIVPWLWNLLTKDRRKMSYRIKWINR